MDDISTTAETSYVKKIAQRFEGNTCSTVAKKNVDMMKQLPTVHKWTPKAEKDEEEIIVPGLGKRNIGSVQDQNAAPQSCKGTIGNTEVHT